MFLCAHRNGCLRSENYLDLALCSFSCIWTLVRFESWVWKYRCISSRHIWKELWGCFRNVFLFSQTWPSDIISYCISFLPVHWCLTCTVASVPSSLRIPNIQVLSLFCFCQGTPQAGDSKQKTTLLHSTCWKVLLS